MYSFFVCVFTIYKQIIFIQKTNKSHTKNGHTIYVLCYIQEGSFNTKKSCWTENFAYIWENDWTNEKRRIQQQFRFVYFFSSFFHLAQARPCDCVLTSGCDCVCMHTAQYQSSRLNRARNTHRRVGWKKNNNTNLWHWLEFQYVNDILFTFWVRVETWMSNLLFTQSELDSIWFINQTFIYSH